MKNIFKGKKVLVTGHTGFKGSWLALWLVNMGAKVTGISLKDNVINSHFSNIRLKNKLTDIRLDIRNKDGLNKEIVQLKPDFVFHLAAQSLVSESYVNPTETWETNVMGTINLLDSLRNLKNKCNAVIITSDKCYDNVEWVWGYRETDKLGGPDPYSGSKGAAEIAISSYVRSYFSTKSNNVNIASARAGNVIGGGDWSKDRIIPDVIKSWQSQKEVILRNPNSTRPWQHVLEPLSGYLSLAVNLNRNKKLHGQSFNFGPSDNNNYKVVDLVKSMSLYSDYKKWKINKTTNNNYESNLLKLNCDKILFHINWQSILTFTETIKMTMEWYNFYKNDRENIEKKSIEQIHEYEKLLKNRALFW